MHVIRILLFIATLHFLHGCVTLQSPKSIEGRFATLNKMGWTKIPEDEYSKDFIAFATSHNEWNLEVGAAFGLTARKAVLGGAKMIVNDLDPKHLDIFKNSLNEKYHSRIKLLTGNFLNIDIENEGVKSILASRVLHMMKGSDIEKAAKLMYRWLQPEGKVFIIAATPYHKSWYKFIPQYEKNLKSGKRFPGEIHNLPIWSEEMAKYNPSFLHLMDIDILGKIFLDAGFKIEKFGYIACDNKDVDSVREDKKGSFGIILRK